MNAAERESLITSEKARELFTYCEETGALRWKENRCSSARAGGIAGVVKTDGRIQICIGGVKYLAHRLIWVYMTGSWPVGQIDHIDGCHTNNSWANLRDVTPEINQQNRRKPNGGSRSGFLGVSYRSASKKWVATIRVAGRNRFLGSFSTPECASAVYIAAKRRLHPGCTI